MEKGCRSTTSSLPFSWGILFYHHRWSHFKPNLPVSLRVIQERDTPRPAWRSPALGVVGNRCNDQTCFQRLAQFQSVFIPTQVNVLILQAPPQAFHEPVVHPSPTPIHGHLGSPVHDQPFLWPVGGNQLPPNGCQELVVEVQIGGTPVDPAQRDTPNRFVVAVAASLYEPGSEAMLWQGNRDVYRARPVAFTRGPIRLFSPSRWKWPVPISSRQRQIPPAILC